MGILLFNWVGYRLLGTIAEDNASRRLESRLERQQYVEDQLISIKVPLTHLAYYNTSAAFERIDGKIEVDGVPYRYVERRLYNDSLEMLCIPNAAELKLRQAGNDYFRLVADLDQDSGTGTHSHLTRSFATDPYICIEDLKVPEPPCTLIQNGEYSPAYLPAATPSEDERPPAYPAV